MNDADDERPKCVEQAESHEGFFDHARSREGSGVMFAGGSMGVPVVMDVVTVLVKVGVFTEHFGMGRREFSAEPLGNAGEIEDAEQNEHEADGELHGESDARRDDQVKQDDGGTDEDDGDGVAESPESANQRGFGEGTLAADNRRDGDDMIGIGGMAHAEEKADDENGEAAEHSGAASLVGTEIQDNRDGQRARARQVTGSQHERSLRGRRWLALLAFEDAHEFGGGVGETRAATGNDIEMARHVELANLDFLQRAMLDFPIDAHAGNDGDAHAHLDKAFNAFDGGHFHGHVERGAVTGEKFDHAATEGRFDNVGDEVFLAEFLDFDFALFGERMLGRDDESQFVFQDFGSLKLRIARDEGDSTEVEAVVHDFVRDVAGEHAVQADLDAGVRLAESGEGGEKGVDGTFIDAEGKFATLEAFQFHEALFDFVTQVQQAFGIFAEQGASIRQADGTGTADEERLAEGLFELADGQTDSRLGAVEPFGGAREAAFASDGQKDLQFA